MPLARVLNEAVDRTASDEMPRSEVIQDMAEAAGITAGTVNQILNGEIDCPPIERLNGFAEVLNGVTATALRREAEGDGCMYGDNNNSAGGQSKAAQDDARFKALEDQLAKQSELLEQQSKALEASNAKAEANAKAARHLQVRAEVTERFNAAKSLAHGLMNDSGKLTPAAYKHLFGEDNDAAKSALNGHIGKATGEEGEGPTLDQIGFYLDMVSQFGETKAAFVPTSKPNVEKPDYSGVASADEAEEKAFEKQFADYAIRMGDKELIKNALVTAKADNATDLIEKLEAALND